MGIESEENQLIIRRLLKKNGKSRVYLNGQPCTVSDLRRIVFPTTTQGHLPLIEITGQHESRDLISTHRQMDILDQFSGSLSLRGQVTQALDNRNQIRSEMEKTQKSLSTEGTADGFSGFSNQGNRSPKAQRR